jgi:ATP-dependent DNA ligase
MAMTCATWLWRIDGRSGEPPSADDRIHSQPFLGDAKVIFQLIDKAGIEGMVSKRRDSKYRSSRSTNALKVTSYATGDIYAWRRARGRSP